jgi:hypothetical protein
MKSLAKCFAFGAGFFACALLIGETIHWSIRD